MKITNVKIKNFRLLDDIEINLEDITTAIVGKNNSGKTSFSEIFNIFMNSKKFEFEDFSLCSQRNFYNSYFHFTQISDLNKKEKIEEIIKLIPKIQLILTAEYDNMDNWSNLKPFITSLNNDNKIYILFEYSPKDSEKFFTHIKSLLEDGDDLIDIVKLLFKDNYQITMRPYSETENTEIVESKDIEKLLQCHFIEAQRDLEDSKSNNTKLSSIFQKQYDYQTKKDDSSSDELVKATDEANKDIEKKLKDFFKTFIESFQYFGFPGIDNEKLQLQSKIEVENLFRNNVKLVYNHDDNLLPEKYNGLGYKNLMYIISKILSFEILHQDSSSDLNLLFIEEPEAHMHPQMQMVFIKNINDFLKEKGFNAQVIISTHSSHILTNAEFETIRYFTKEKYCSKIKDLKQFSNSLSSDETLSFLKQYLTLDKGELFFSDKAILFEGVVERLLMPIFIKKVDASNSTKLSEQYISYIEVGGAYMNKFKDLLEFLEIKTLLITDIDSIDISDSRKKIEISNNQNIETSNSCLINWIPKKNKIIDLLNNTTDDEKIDNKVRVAYQTKLSSSTNLKCGRSFEEAFILDNLQFALDNKDKLLSLSQKLLTYNAIANIEQDSYSIVEDVKKTDFAFDLLTNQDGWVVPTYINEGLVWLSQQ